jgi:hypothetical protein
MSELRKNAPDLAALVDEERMTLAEATGAWRERQRVTAQKIEAGQNAARTLLLSFSSNVETIRQAIELGADIVFDDEHIALFRQATDRLDEMLDEKE